jgi:membrane protein required for colicin V production
MNIVDIIVIVIFASSIVIGFGRGFVKEVISFLSLIAAVVIATLFSNQVATSMTNSPTVRHLIGRSSDAMGVSTAEPASYIAVGLSFFLILIGVLIIGAIIGAILNSIFQFGVLGAGNRIFGAVFGLVRGFIIAIILVFVLQLTPLSEETWWKDSRFVVASKPAVEWLSSSTSPALTGLKDKVSKKFKNGNDENENNAKTDSKTNPPPSRPAKQ